LVKIFYIQKLFFYDLKTKYIYSNKYEIVFLMKVPERLETKRLVLRSYVEEDINLFLNLIKNDTVNKNLNLRSNQQTHKGIKSLFSSILNSYDIIDPIFALAIINKENKNYIGTCGLISLRESTTVECFYALLPLYRGNGFAIESMLKLLEYSFEELKILKIVIFIHPNNTRAWKVAERIGMKYMGHIKHNNIVPKAMLFSIEEKEYKMQRFH